MLFIIPVILVVVGQTNDKVGSTYEYHLEINTQRLNRVDRNQLELPPFFSNCLLDCLAVQLLVVDTGGWNVAFSLWTIVFTAYLVLLLLQKGNFGIESSFGIIHGREDTNCKQSLR